MKKIVTNRGFFAKTVYAPPFFRIITRAAEHNNPKTQTRCPMKPIVLSGRRNDPRRALQILAIILLNILVIAMLPGARDGA